MFFDPTTSRERTDTTRHSCQSLPGRHQHRCLTLSGRLIGKAFYEHRQQRYNFDGYQLQSEAQVVLRFGPAGERGPAGMAGIISSPLLMPRGKLPALFISAALGRWWNIACIPLVDVSPLPFWTLPSDRPFPFFSPLLFSVVS